MDFGFNDDQELLRSTTRGFLADHQSLQSLRRRIEEPDVFDEAGWQRGAELGWTAMLVPHEFEGGSVTGQPLVDLMVLAEELGRELHPGPFVPCNVVADAIARFGTEAQRHEHLPRLARGECTAGWCLSGDGSPERDAVDVRATPDGGGWRLDGAARYVHAGGSAAVLLVVAHTPDGDVLNVLVPGQAPGLAVRALSGLDLTRRFSEITFDRVSAPADSTLRGGWDVVEQCVAVATVLQAGESVGAADAIFASTVEYAKKRAQFGRTIGSFQAIKHRLASLQVRLEAMRVGAEYAALALGDGLEDGPEAVATAGAYVDDTFAHLCGEALQLHGGIGFTWEHDVHLYLRRAKVSQVLYGDGAWHRERLLRMVEESPNVGEVA